MELDAAAAAAGVRLIVHETVGSTNAEALLQARLTETPERPLLLMMGSSRTVMCFRPENLAELHTSAGAQVLPFNFSHLAAGPLCSRRSRTGSSTSSSARSCR